MFRAIFGINSPRDFWKIWNCPRFIWAISKFSKMHSDNLFPNRAPNYVITSTNFIDNKRLSVTWQSVTKLLFPGCNSDLNLLLGCYFSKITHLLYSNNFCCYKTIILIFYIAKLEMCAEREKGRWRENSLWPPIKSPQF